MDKDIIRAYLWQDIIRLGFSPSGTKDQKSWLLQYGQSLKDFWEMPTYPKAPSQTDKVISATIDSSISIGMSYEYFIEDDQKFGVMLMYAPPQKNRGLMWEHHMDGQYFSFPSQTFLTNYNQQPQAIQKMRASDIGDVIDSLIMHPTPHQHIKSPLNNHYIRVGGGLMNPFLYLFHLRVQLCPDNERRQSERNRLISLFDTAIKEKSTIAPNELMKIP
jgi:hypothetical protein